MKDLITVVVPIYNVEKYLNKCVDSILNQTYKNLQIILVDDGSPDNCGKICNEYKIKDSRVEVIHQENKGLSGARNAAIDIAKGEFITFVDSDDWLELDMIESLYKLMIDNTADIAVTSLNQAFEDGTLVNNSTLEKTLIMNTEEALECYLFNEYLTPCVCGKLWRTSLWNDIRCPEGYLFEDQYTTYKLIDKAEKVVFAPYAKYFYFKRDGSIGHTSFSDKTYKLYDGVQEQYRYITEKYPDIKASLNVAKITWELVFINMMLRSGENDENLIYKVKDFTKKHIRDVWKCSFINNTRKIQMSLFAYNLSLYKKMYFRYKKGHQLN